MSHLRQVGISSCLDGYCVYGLVSLDMGETFEAVYHPAVFRTQQDAKSFGDKIQHRAINLANWVVKGLPNSTYYLQRDPDENPAFYSPIKKGV